VWVWVWAVILGVPVPNLRKLNPTLYPDQRYTQTQTISLSRVQAN